VVDEVLAVGDASFQKKCLGKMEDVADKQSRTVLFVSHQMNAVTRLCNRCLVLRSGILSLDSRDTKEAVSSYLCEDTKELPSSWSNDRGIYQGREVVPIQLRIMQESSPEVESADSFENNSALIVAATFSARDIDEAMNVGIALYNQSGDLLLWSFTSDCEPRYWPSFIEGVNKFKTSIPSHFFNEGTYRIEFLASYHMRKFIISPGEGPEISFSIRGGLSPSPHWIQARPGILAPVWRWDSQ
jgi:lipopolysaccharide transport system ATP-binding protein